MCGNWQKVLDHFHQSCCLIDEIICFWACFWNCERIIIKTNGDYQTHYCTKKIHNQPDNFPEVLCEMLDSPFWSVEFSQSNDGHFNLLDGLRWASILKIYMKFFYLPILLLLYVLFYIHPWLILERYVLGDWWPCCNCLESDPMHW